MARDTRLLRYRQTAQFVSDAPTYRMVQFDGNVEPILVLAQKRFRFLTQTGEATGRGLFLVAPDPLYPDALVEAPQVSYAREAQMASRLVTTWTYVMAVSADATLDYHAIARWPTTPAWIEIPTGGGG